jgi:hypothetical protein
MDRVSYFGKQLRRDYRWDEKLYPGAREDRAVAGLFAGGRIRAAR